MACKIKMKENKHAKSLASFLELGKLLTCVSCQKLAQNPQNLGCDHTFCLECSPSYLGKPCPTCGFIAEKDSCKPDYLTGNLIEAYLSMSNFFGVDVNKLPQDVQTPVRSEISTPSTIQKSTSRNNLLKKNLTSSTPASKCGSATGPSAVKKRERKVSLNESLDSSVIVSTSVTKVDKRNQKGETQLHVACIKQNLQKIRELLLLGANPNTQDNAGWTPLHEVVGYGNQDIVTLLLEHGANPNIPGGQNETPLHDAVASNRPSIVRILVSHGADVNARNSRGLTPKDLCPNINEDMQSALLTSTTVPATPSLDRPRGPMQMVHLFVLNPEKKSQPRLNKLARTLGFKLVSTYSSQVTHLAVRLEEPVNAIKNNPNFYSAVLQGHFIVDFQWIEESEKLERLTDPSKYEIDGTLRKVSQEGAQHRLNGASQLPGLFNNCFFYLHGLFDSPSKADITQWIKHGRGTVLTRSPNPESIVPGDSLIPYHASPSGPLSKCSHYILYDSRAKAQPSLKYNMAHVKTLSVDWLVSCIENFSLIDPF